MRSYCQSQSKHQIGRALDTTIDLPHNQQVDHALGNLAETRMTTNLISLRVTSSFDRFGTNEPHQESRDDNKRAQK
jgi:hypothetical protein